MSLNAAARRRVAVSVGLLVATVVGSSYPVSQPDARFQQVGSVQTSQPPPAPTPAEERRLAAAGAVVAPPPSDERRLVEVTTISGDISPKSVVASDDGLFFAQNMMYRHTVTVYDRSFELVATIDDEVRLEALGVDGPGEPVQGAPVEAAFSPDGRHAYVSNYSMYGPGFGAEGSDSCTLADGVDDSFLYRVDVGTLEIDRAIEVGAVPKYVAVTPDGRLVLVANWCSYDLSVVDAASGREVRRVDIGRHPRGIAVDPTSRTAYVAVMGGDDIAVVDLADFAVGWIGGVGDAPRHLVMDPAGRYLYATLNGDGLVVKIDLAAGGVVDAAATGVAPRSMDISADGRALFVVNYESNTVSKLDTDDMEVVQEVAVGHHPIGITYDDPTGHVWVACYSGTIHVFRDT